MSEEKGKSSKTEAAVERPIICIDESKRLNIDELVLSV